MSRALLAVGVWGALALCLSAFPAGAAPPGPLPSKSSSGNDSLVTLTHGMGGMRTGGMGGMGGMGHVGSMGHMRSMGPHFYGSHGRRFYSHDFHHHHRHNRFFFVGVPYYDDYYYNDDYSSDCLWSRRYRRWVCSDY